MWADRLPPEQLQTLIHQVQSALPAPSAHALRFREALRGSASVDQLAERLHNEPGFAWVHRTESGDRATPLLFHKPLATVSYADRLAVISGPGGTVRIPASGFDILEAVLEAWRGAPGALLTGFLSYDLGAELEDLGPQPLPDFQFPQLAFGLYDSHLALENGAWVISGADAWRAANGPESAEELLRQAGTYVFSDTTTLNRGPRRSLSNGNLTSRPDRSAFESAVERTVATIHAGDIFQTNLCRRIEGDIEPGTEWYLFQSMREISPSRYEAFLRINDGDGQTSESQTILSISPELFLKVQDGFVESSPIKGTRPRGETNEEDQALAKDLLASEKDRAELAMIVDVVRNDLGRVCRTGSIEVLTHAELMTLPTVHHSFSTVRGHLRLEAGTIGLLRAAFPAASITGAPKIEAMRVAMSEERQRRGPCMGAIGWISLDGDMELSVAIRTAFSNSGRVFYYGGCGITADSIPHQEFLESRHKIAAFVRAMGKERDSDW
jgi:para-aminobenzoate synthetase component I